MKVDTVLLVSFQLFPVMCMIVQLFQVMFMIDQLLLTLQKKSKIMFLVLLPPNRKYLKPALAASDQLMYIE